MRALAQKQDQPGTRVTGGRTMSSPVVPAESHQVHPQLTSLRTIGNQAVQRMLKAGTKNDKEGPVTDLAGIGHGFSGIPAHVDGHAEKEADGAAERVMQMPEPGLRTSKRNEGSSRAIQPGGQTHSPQERSFFEPRFGHDFSQVRVHSGEPVASSGGQLHARDPGLARGKLQASRSVQSSAVQLFRGAGKLLEERTRAFYEARFGLGFSEVRIHDDSESAALNRQLRARAFTVGNHVAFAGEERSRIAPGSHLLAHELAHVVQQRQAGVARVMRQPTEEEENWAVAPPCPGSCHVHVEHYQRAFGGGLQPLPVAPLERKPVPLSQTELQTLYDWISRSEPGTVSRVAPPASNELQGGPLKADVAAEYAKHEEELRAKPNNRVQIIRFEVPDESDPDWSRYRASEISADQKKKTFAALGLRPEEKVFSRSVSSKDFSAYIAAQNADATVFGIIVQLPTPPQLRADVGKIAPGKDLDALSAGAGRTFKAPATAEGVVRLVLAVWKPGQTVAVIGGGSDPSFGALGFVGGAVVELLRDRGITVKVFEKGDDLREVKKYDLVVSAVGTPRVVKEEHLKPEHELVVDTGFIPERGGKPVGDVEESARSIPRYVTAVPGGTGPVEMAVLMERAAKLLGIKARTWQVELRDGKLRAVFVE